MKAVEKREEGSRREGQEDGEQRADQAVRRVFKQLKEGAAGDPHRVKAVHGGGLSDDVLKADLPMESYLHGARENKTTNPVR